MKQRYYLNNFIIFFFVLIGFIGTSFCQNQNNFKQFYLKLNPLLNFSSAENVLTNTNLSDLQNTYPFIIKDAYALNRSQIDALSKKSKTGFTLKNTFAIEIELSSINANLFLNKLKELEEVIYAYQANTIPIPPPHDIGTITSNYEANQGYLETNPGLNVRYAWDNNITGAGVRIRDVEYGLNINHEDLDHQNASITPNNTINSGATEAYTEHGTAVGGIVYANKGTYGISGIAHGADDYILFPEWTEETGYNRTLAVSNAIASSISGDIIIYEMQTGGQNGDFVPAEYSQSIWDLTKAATDAGIIIVAAAGNGNENLDDAFYDAYNARGDSGAIIVGAGSSTLSHSPLGFSTYGNRVNVHAWGQNVWSTGKYGGSILVDNDFNQSYYQSFSGTSSATAVMGGFTAVVQSYYLDQSGSYLTPSQMRNILIASGIPQGAGKNIGPMPYMNAAMDEVDLLLSTSKFENSSFTVSPNPSNGVININFSQTPSKEINMSIYSVLGQKVFNKSLNSKRNNFNISALNKGVYIITLTNASTNISKKLIIN